MIANYALYVVLRAARVILRFLPLGLAYFLADAAGLVAYVLVTPARRAICSNLSVVLGQPATSRAVRQAARDAFANDAKNWVDTLRIHLVTGADLEQRLRIDRWERLTAVLGEGRGLVLVTAHLGNFDLVGQILMARGYHLTIPVERMQPPALFDLLTSERRSKGINIVPLDEAPRALLRAVKGGEIVGLAGDRNLAGRTVEVEFFGRLTRLPAGPASLARRTGAPMMAGLGIRMPGGRFKGLLSEVVEAPRSADAAADVQQATQHIARLLEDCIRQYPGQWLVFSPIWPDPWRPATVTMNQAEVAI